MAQNVFLIPSADEAAANAYRQGFNDGYAMAVAQDDLELQAMKRQQEREAIINWQGLCESREGDDP